jgi:hypothetical protein
VSFEYLGEFELKILTNLEYESGDYSRWVLLMNNRSKSTYTGVPLRRWREKALTRAS